MKKQQRKDICASTPIYVDDGIDRADGVATDTALLVETTSTDGVGLTVTGQDCELPGEGAEHAAGHRALALDDACGRHGPGALNDLAEAHAKAGKCTHVTVAPRVTAEKCAARAVRRGWKARGGR